MRVALGTDNYYPVANGVSYFTQRLAHGLITAGHDVLVVAPSRTFRTTHSQHDGVPIVGIRSVPLIFYRGFRFTPPGFIRGSIRAALRQFKPDVVHIQSHFFLSRAVGDVARQLELPLVGTNHFMPENLMPYVPLAELAEPALRWIGWEQFLAVYQHLDAVATPTKTAARLIESIGLKHPVQVISCGVDLERFHPRTEAANRRRPMSRPRFLYVGRLDGDKRLDLLLRAVARAQPSAPLELVLAGKGVERPALERLAIKLGITAMVTFTGYVPDAELPALYRSADCFVMPSTNELQSIVTLEAMASGLPVIAADAVALPELVTTGVNGQLFVPDDVASLAMALQTLASNAEQRQSYGQESRQRVAAHDIHRTIDAYLKFYRSALG